MLNNLTYCIVNANQTDGQVTQPASTQTQRVSHELCGNAAGAVFYGLCATALAVTDIALATGTGPAAMDWKIVALASAPVMLTLAYGLVGCSRKFARTLKTIEQSPHAG